VNQRPEVFLIEFLGGLRPNTEVMGRKEQVMPRYADPEDGVLAQSVYGPEQLMIGPVAPGSMFNSMTEKVFPGYTQRRDALRRKIVETLSRKGLV